MSPDRKTIWTKTKAGYAEELASEAEINRLQQEASGLVSTNPQKAGELFTEAGKKSKLRGLIYSAEDPFETMFREAEVEDDHDFQFDVLPLMRETISPRGEKVVEFISEPKKEDVYAATFLKFIEKDKRGRFKYKSVRDVGLATLPPEVNKNDPDIVRKAAQRVHNTNYYYKTAFLANQKAMENDPTLIKNSILQESVKNLNPKNISGIVSAIVEGHRRLWMTRQENAKVKNLPPLDPFDYVTNEGNRKLYKHLIEEYPDMPTTDFIKNVIQRFGREATTTLPKNEGKKSITPEEILYKPSVSQGIEMVLAVKLLKAGVMDELKGLLGGDPVKMAKRNGWKHEGQWDTAIINSCQNAFNHPERGRKQVEEELEQPLLDTKVKAFVYAIATPDERKKWGRGVNNSEYSSLKFLYAISRNVVGDIQKTDALIDILFPIHEIQTLGNGIVVDRKRVNR